MVENGLEYVELIGWSFFIDEVSAGVYKVWGKDAIGHNIEIIGTDPDLLLEKCKTYASQFITKDDTKT